MFSPLLWLQGRRKVWKSGGRGVSRNPMSFGREGFASIPAKIWGRGIPCTSCSDGPWLAPARSPVALLNGTVQLVGQHLRTKIPSFEVYCPAFLNKAKRFGFSSATKLRNTNVCWYLENPVFIFLYLAWRPKLTGVNVRGKITLKSGWF